MHLFFLCTFARAAWYAHPWYLRTDLLTENHQSMQTVIHALLNMNHPHASISNIFNFLWCIWKARNDCLFARKNPSPHQVHHAATAIADCNAIQQVSPSNGDSTIHPQHTGDLMELQRSTLPAQGESLNSHLTIAGTKIFMDAAFRSTKIPGFGGSTGTGIGVSIHCFDDAGTSKIKIQESAPFTLPPAS